VVPRFLPVPVGGRALAGHDEAVLTVPSPGKDGEFMVMMKQSRRRAKNLPAGRQAWHQRVGRQPY